jgi:hypothetical protein
MGFYVVAPDGLRPIKFGEQRALLMLWPGIDFIFKLVDMRHLHPRALERPAEAAQP